MRKKILGTDLKVSAIGLGCMGMNHAYGASADKTEMINLIAQAVDIVCPVTAIQNRYSMMARWHEKLFPVLEELNIGFVAFHHWQMDFCLVNTMHNLFLRKIQTIGQLCRNSKKILTRKIRSF